MLRVLIVGFVLAFAAPSVSIAMNNDGVQMVSTFEKKNPWVALGLSAVFPGLGQHYNGEHGKGIAQHMLWAMGAAMAVIGLEDNNGAISSDPDDDDRYLAIGALILLGNGIWSLVDAPLSANRINREAETPRMGFRFISGGVAVAYRF